MIMDVAFCKDEFRMEQAFRNKIEKYSVDNGHGEPLYEQHAIIPVIINYRGFLYDKTRVLLEKYVPELNLIRLMCEAMRQIVIASYNAT
jgi:hypothetical protein